MARNGTFIITNWRQQSFTCSFCVLAFVVLRNRRVTALCKYIIRYDRSLLKRSRTIARCWSRNEHAGMLIVFCNRSNADNTRKAAYFMIRDCQHTVESCNACEVRWDLACRAFMILSKTLETSFVDCGDVSATSSMCALPWYLTPKWANGFVREKLVRSGKKSKV